jgi:hypothetical protein
VRAYNWRRWQAEIEKKRRAEVAALRLRKEEERVQRVKELEVAEVKKRRAWRKASAAISNNLLGLSACQTP